MYWHPTKVMSLNSIAKAEGLTIDQAKEHIRKVIDQADNEKQVLRERLMIRMSHVPVPMTLIEVEKKPEWENKEY